jgi:hypothetical protein
MRAVAAEVRRPSRLAAKAWDLAILAADLAAGRFLGRACDALWNGTPAERAEPWNLAVGILLGLAVVSQLVALAVFRNDLRGRRDAPPLDHGPWAGLVFFCFWLAMDVAIGLSAAADVLGLETGSAVFVASCSAAVLASVTAYVWLCVRVTRPAAGPDPEPSSVRVFACLALMLPLVVTAMGPVEALASHADLAKADFHGFWSVAGAAVAGAAVLAAVGSMTAWFPRWLASRALGRGLSGWGFFLGLFVGHLFGLLF